jgi:hypothetical protein
MTAAKTYRPFLEVVLETAGNPVLPEGYTTWGYKITRPDLRSYGGFRWPFPGGTVTDPSTVKDGEACPSADTGGFCIALSLAGAATGGHGHATILLLAYKSSDIAGSDGHSKIRVSHCLVFDVIDGTSAYRDGAGADLAGANLRGADLAGANLTDANLAGANLTGANLADAYLPHANLADAYLTGANLAGANLTGVYLRGAYLPHAYLADAYLAGANLADAYLAGANLADANLAGANLAGADLAGADLAGADLAGALGLP